MSQMNVPNKCPKYISQISVPDKDGTLDGTSTIQYVVCPLTVSNAQKKQHSAMSIMTGHLHRDLLWFRAQHVDEQKKSRQSDT